MQQAIPEHKSETEADNRFSTKQTKSSRKDQNKKECFIKFKKV